MSASLVGSEMCIRDRFRRAAPLPRCSALFCAVRCPAVLLLPGGAAAPPVSYTHLTLPTICSV
eukprot:4795509-Alexandrium_andersonii.AAC.1